MQPKSNTTRTLKLFFLSTLIALSLSFCNVSTYALCLAAGKVRLIVWAELAASISLPLMATGHARLCRRFPSDIVQTGIFILSATALLVSAATVSHLPVSGLALPLLMLAKYHAAFSNLAFWSMATSQRSGQESARSPGLASAGFPLGWMGGGLIHLIANRYATTSMQLFVSALAVLLATMVFLNTRSVSPGAPARTSPQAYEPNRCVRLSNPNKRPWMLYFLCIVSAIGSSLVGFLYNSSTSAHFGDRAAVARFLGLMDVLTGVAQFICACYFTDRVIRRFGTIAGMIALPFALTCCVLLLLIGFHLGGKGSTLIWIASITRISEIVLRKSLQKPSFAVYCQRFAAGQRQHVLRTIELVVKPLASTVAATLMTLVAVNSGQNIETLAWLCLSLVAGWLLVAVIFARREVAFTMVSRNRREVLVFSRYGI